MNLLAIATETTTELIQQTSTTNPMLDKNGQFVSPEQAVRNFSTLWKEWDIVNKFLDKLPTLILAVATIIIGFFLAKLVSKILVKTMKARNVDPTVYMFIDKFVTVIIKVAFVLSAVSMFFNVNSFLAAFGAAGLTAGLGLQDSVSQFASGIQILLNRPFKNGDYIEVAGQAGFVDEIRFMNTVITTVDNKRIVIPNTHLTKNEIVNFSAEDKRRVDLSYSIAYTDDIETAKSVLKNTISDIEKILTDPEPNIFVGTHGESSVELIVRVWCKSVDYWDVYFSMQEKVKLAFDKNGIHIPFNQLDVHIIDNKK
ncbi:MAG: mechanosensitive ion channel [Oscillospiraceae bacterium]|nr:mechanosensitive ion channel [Oscillospiraceae bacterium]MDD6527470.1 mechanosensitive ion channel [Oscillospiraceae bacterium]